MLVSNRTSFDKGYRHVAHVVPSGAGGVYSTLCAKYGGDSVFLATATTAQLAFNAAINSLYGGVNDCVRVYPGTYVLGATISLTKTCTLESSTGNARDVIIDAATSDVVGITVGALGDYSQIKNISMSVPDTTNLTGISIPSTAPGCVVEGCIFTGDDTAAQIGIGNAGIGLTVRKCSFYLVRFGVKSTAGSYGLVEDCYFQTSNATSGIGVEFMAGDYHRIRNNTFNTSHANTLPIKLGTTTLCTLCGIENNLFHAGQAVLVTNVNTSTFAAWDNKTSGITGAAVVDAT